MKLSPISLASVYQNKKSVNQKSQFLSIINDSFSKKNVPSFSGDNKYFEDAKKTDINGYWDYRTMYFSLLDNVYSQEDVDLRDGSDFINNKDSLKDVLNDLCHPAPWGYESTLVNKAKDEPLVVASKNGSPLISIKVSSPHSFFDLFTDNLDTLNTKIVFHDPNDEFKTIEFGLDEDGDFLLEKPHELHLISIGNFAPCALVIFTSQGLGLSSFRVAIQ